MSAGREIVQEEILTQAILLAGGLGTRLRSVASDRPELMALIEGEPFMEYVIREPVRHRVTDIVFAVGYEGTMVGEHFGDRAVSGFYVDYAYEETLLGMAGAIKNVGRFITEDRFYVLNGDTFYQTDYTRLLRQQDSRNLDIALVLRSVSDISRYDQAVLDRGRSLIGFNERTEDAREGMINGGIYLMKQRLLDETPRGEVLLENDIVPRWLSEGRCLGGFVNDGYSIDTGIPEAYSQFQKDVKNKVVIRQPKRETERGDIYGYQRKGAFKSQL